MTTKIMFRIAFTVEIVVFFLVLFFSDRGCYTDCFEGVNNVVLYVLPVIGITIFLYIYDKTNKIIEKKSKLNSGHRALVIFTPIVVFILLVFGIYYLTNT